jgi:hypothetical protein
MKLCRISLYICLAFQISRPTIAYGPHKYCCDIAKRHRVLEACTQDPIVINGQNCSTACSKDYALYKAINYGALRAETYDCFKPFFSNASRTDASHPLNLRCGQTYQDGTLPAPDLNIDYDFCNTECWGWELSEGKKPNSWAAPLVQYILPAVIFSMTIPRRVRYKVPEWLFKVKWNRWIIMKLPFALVAAPAIRLWDGFLWIFEIFVAAGPMLVGGLLEAMIDSRIVDKIHHESTAQANLTPKQKAQLLVAVLGGNINRSRDDPETALHRHFGLLSTKRELSTGLYRMQNVLSSQSSFGEIVGAPVLFFIGAFIWQVTSLRSNKGDNDTAHALAFGMEWMVIVHVSIISGCLLASNNPSMLTAIAADDRLGPSSPTAQSIMPEFFRWFKRTPIYDSRFKPVSLWNRGCMKKCWVENTTAWKLEKPPGTYDFRKEIELSAWHYVLIVVSAFLLIAIPSALAINVSYHTPRVCVSCRSMTFITYTAAQTLLIIFAAIRAYDYHSTENELNHSKPRPDINHLFRDIRWIFGDFDSGRWLFLASAFATALVALFTGFAGTLMQILGVYRSCICSIPAYAWFLPGPLKGKQSINVASDTQVARDNSRYWEWTGVAAMVFMALVTCWAWWYQEGLRRRVDETIIGLNEVLIRRIEDDERRMEVEEMRSEVEGRRKEVKEGRREVERRKEVEQRRREVEASRGGVDAFLLQ